MKSEEAVIIVDKSGQQGLVELEQFNQNEQSSLLVHFGERKVLVPVELLVAQDNGTFYLPIALADLVTQTEGTASETEASLVLPVVEEQLTIQKRKVETGVRIGKQVHETIEQIDVPLVAEEVEVKRIAINRQVDTPPTMRQEGDTLILPLLEEILVVQKQLFLKEEVHITTKRTKKQYTDQVTLRSEEVVVEPLQTDTA